MRGSLKSLKKQIEEIQNIVRRLQVWIDNLNARAMAIMDIIIQQCQPLHRVEVEINHMCHQLDTTLLGGSLMPSYPTLYKKEYEYKK